MENNLDISVIAGIVLSILFEYFPGVAGWYENLDKRAKQDVMALALLTVSLLASSTPSPVPRICPSLFYLFLFYRRECCLISIHQAGEASDEIGEDTRNGAGQPTAQRAADHGSYQHVWCAP